MHFIRGPLPEGQHPMPGTVYFCPDHDIPLAASGLARTPPIHGFAFTDKPAVLLEAHRAPDEWFAAAVLMPQLVVQGDPLAYRPRSCSLFASQLATCEEPERPLKPHAEISPTLTAALPRVVGRWMVLCGCRDSREKLYAHLRPNGMLEGDGAMDRFGRFTQVHETPTSAYTVSVDGGRRLARLDALFQHIVLSPSMLRSGEYDTILVMPDVPETIGRAACRRARYKVIGIGHSAMAYLL